VALNISSSPVLSSAAAQAAGNREIKTAARIRMIKRISEIRAWALFTIASVKWYLRFYFMRCLQASQYFLRAVSKAGEEAEFYFTLREKCASSLLTQLK
jgi:hypothetical protein